MNNVMHKCLILTELLKAFDALDNKILLQNIACLGFKITVVKWSDSYLSNRIFFVFVDDIL